MHLVRRRETPSRVTRPRRLRRAAAAGALAVATLVPAAAEAAAPPNDHYLASTILRAGDGAFPTSFTSKVDTTDATIQADLFQPDANGQPLGGGPAEPVGCGGATLGKSVWYDFAPPLAGGVELTAQGYDTTIALYEYDEHSSRITRQIGCSATPGSGETFTVPEEVRPGKHYTVQVGGAVGADGVAAGGPLQFGFAFFGDRDADGILDALPDRCPDLAGVSSAGGCPPTLRPSVSYASTKSGSGIRLLSLRVSKLPSGSSIRVSGGGATQTKTVTKNNQVVSLATFAGRTIRGGSSLEIRVTHAKRGSGEFRFGAIGASYRYPVSGGKLRPRVERCLLPGTTTPRKSCRKPAR